MKKIKKYSIQMAIALIIFLLLLLFFINKKMSQLKDKNQTLIHSRDSSFLVAKYYKNKSGELIGQVNTLELTTKDLKELGKSIGVDNYKLKQQIGNLSNLVGYWKGKASMKGSDTARLRDTVYVDKKGIEIKAEKLEWNNKYLFIDGLYNPIDKKLTFDYKYDLGGFELIAYRKNMGFFKHRQLVTDIKFGDPNMKVTEFQGMVIKEPKKKFWETRGFAFGVGALFGVWVTK